MKKGVAGSDNRSIAIRSLVRIGNKEAMDALKNFMEKGDEKALDNILLNGTDEQVKIACELLQNLNCRLPKKCKEVLSKKIDEKKINRIVDEIYDNIDSMLPPTIEEYMNTILKIGQDAVMPLINALEERHVDEQYPSDEAHRINHLAPCFIMRVLAEIGDKRAIKPIEIQKGRPDDQTTGIKEVWSTAEEALDILSKK
jgi:hypothetical protein